MSGERSQILSTFVHILCSSHAQSNHVPRARNEAHKRETWLHESAAELRAIRLSLDRGLTMNGIEVEQNENPRSLKVRQLSTLTTLTP